MGENRHPPVSVVADPRLPISPSPPRQRGIALLVVLWACALLAILLGAYAVATRTEGLQARYQFASTQARYAAEAGIARAVYALREPDPKRRWIADGRPYRFRFDGAVVAVSVTDESGKVDLNTATPQVLEGLFRAAGAGGDRAHALAAAVQDWRDADDAAHADGAEAPAYAAAGRDYGPRNGPFASVEELQMVLGMDASLYATLAPAITVWSGRNLPDPTHAPSLVLAALPGMDRQKAGDYIQARRQRVDPTQPAPGLPGGLLPGSGGRSVTQSIHAEATLANGTRAGLDVAIRMTGMRNAADAPYTVLRWQEGGGGLGESRGGAAVRSATTVAAKAGQRR